jgi:hypothetical protein
VVAAEIKTSARRKTSRLLTLTMNMLPAPPKECASNASSSQVMAPCSDVTTHPH